MIQTPKNLGLWDGVEFLNSCDEAVDYVLVCNCLKNNVEVICNPKNVWAVIQEPYATKGHNMWIMNGHKQFSKVFTHIEHVYKNKYKVSHPVLPWHINKSYDELIKMSCPLKTKELSCISSNKVFHPGHKARWDFVNSLIRRNKINMDLFGKGYSFVDDKFDALANYKYSIAIENGQFNNYWTEKIMDCYLSYTLPIYYGDLNLEKYFPSESFIRIDINDVESAEKIILNCIKNDEWSKRYSSILQARQMILDEYQFFPFFCKQIMIDSSFGKAKKIKLKAYKANLAYRILSKIKKIISGG